MIKRGISAIGILALAISTVGMISAAAPSTSSIPASQILNNPTNASVSFIGTPVPSSPVPVNAISLSPGQQIPQNAALGQAYVVPDILPPNWKDVLVLRLNPGQEFQVSGYTGPVVIESTAPSIVTREPNPNYSSTAAAAAAVGNPALSATWVVINRYTVVGHATSSGGVINFDGTWVADNHVVSYQEKPGDPIAAPYDSTITRSASQYLVNEQDPEWLTDSSTGLAYLVYPTAPTGSEYQIDVVQQPALSQQDTAVNYWNPAADEFELTEQSMVLQATQVVPPTNPFPDPNSNIYDQFTPELERGWSGTGIWDSESHLVGIDTYGDGNGYEYAFNGGDIKAFCEEFDIPFTTSTGY